MDKRTGKILKILISVVLALGISVLVLITLILILFSTQREILGVILCILYVSIIAFLVLWNVKNSKKVYWLLAVPVMCIAVGAAVIRYDIYVKNIPTVNEEFYVRRYEPFRDFTRENNLLAKLDGESSLKIIDNLPILDGATALYPVYASFVQAVYPEAEYRYSDELVLCSTTNGAYENLLEGEVDIIFCAGPSDKQVKQFNDKGLNLKLIPIGKEAFVFFVNKENPVDNVTVENIRGIYSGKIRNWNKLNGKFQNIRAFQRPENSGSQTMLEKMMGNIPVIKPRKENVSYGMGGIINQVADYRNFSNAIGYSFLFYSTEMVKNDHIKLLAINGVFPSRETIRDQSYPFSYYFYAITVEGIEQNENTELFIEWILSEQGQELIQKTGYLPL
jgi:phosphate transport system substrate-binding protein